MILCENDFFNVTFQVARLCLTPSSSQSIKAREIRFATLERVFICFITNYKLRSQGQCAIYENELYELKYSFLKGIVRNVNCHVRPKRTFKRPIV